MSMLIRIRNIIGFTLVSLALCAVPAKADAPKLQSERAFNHAVYPKCGQAPRTSCVDSDVVPARCIPTYRRVIVIGQGVRRTRVRHTRSCDQTFKVRLCAHGGACLVGPTVLERWGGRVVHGRVIGLRRIG